MALHELKTWPEYFQAVIDGIKPFEVRKADRNFQVGDVLMLREWSPQTEKYSGRHIGKFVSCILHGGKFGIAPDYVVMGLTDKTPA